MLWMTIAQLRASWKVKWILYVRKAPLIHDLYFSYVVESFFYVKLKFSINTQVHFLAAISTYTVLFSIIFSYKGCLISQRSTHVI